MDDLTLASDFAVATREQWLKLVEGVLKGADFEKVVSHTYDGLRIEPIYPKAEASGRMIRGEAGRWRVSQRVDHPDPQKSNELTLADLEGGADALTLVTRNAPSARGFGLTIRTVDDLDQALHGVMLDLVHLRLDAGGEGRQVAALLIALIERRGLKLGEVALDLALDPIGAMAAMGLLSAPWEVVGARCADTLAGLAERGFSGRAFLADGRPYHEAGASQAQELAAVLATGLAYLRALETGGHSLETARNALSFLLVADADEFLTVAKLRALRRLWARVEEACGLDPKPIRLHAETAWRMVTRRDPWVNLLRTTIATFSAGIGGADAITVLPFTAALGLPDASARRLARNTQLILLDESNLGRVADPAAGAGGFEALTDAMCERAWSLLQEIEREGGIVESLAHDVFQQRIAAVRGRREKAIATRKEPITGTSEFPAIHEEAVSVLMPSPPTAYPRDAGSGPSDRRSEGVVQREPVQERPPHSALAPHARRGNSAVAPFSSLVEAAAQGSSLGTLAATAVAASPIALAPLPSARAAAPFERLRDASDAFLARTGARPRVFLANLGPIAAFTARATFAKNFFEAGGIESATNDGFSDCDAMARAYLESKAKLICLCSSDEIYHEHAISALTNLRKQTQSSIYLAGRPGALEEGLRRAGATNFIFAGCDALKILSEALDAAAAESCGFSRP